MCRICVKMCQTCDLCQICRKMEFHCIFCRVTSTLWRTTSRQWMWVKSILRKLFLCVRCSWRNKNLTNLSEVCLDSTSTLLGNIPWISDTFFQDFIGLIGHSYYCYLVHLYKGSLQYKKTANSWEMFPTSLRPPPLPKLGTIWIS